MKIEEEIKQVSFKNEYHKLIINQQFTGKWVSNLMMQQVKPFKITTQQYNVLRILRGQGNNHLSVNAISNRMIDKMSNVSRLVDKLVEKKLVERKTNNIDRRQMDIRVTKVGLELIQKVEDTEEKLFDKLKNLSEPEAKQLNNLLDKLRG